MQQRQTGRLRWEIELQASLSTLPKYLPGEVLNQTCMKPPTHKKEGKDQELNCLQLTFRRSRTRCRTLLAHLGEQSLRFGRADEPQAVRSHALALRRPSREPRWSGGLVG